MRRIAYRAESDVFCLFLRESDHHCGSESEVSANDTSALLVPLPVMATPSPPARLSTRHRRNTQRQQSLSRATRRRRSGVRGGTRRGHAHTAGALALRRLANRLAAYAPHDGVFQLRLPGTYAIRLSQLTTEATYSTLGPALCVAAQGAKVVMLGREVLEYDPAHLLVFAVDLPVSTQVIRASRKDPYLGFTMLLDPARVGELAARVYPRGVPKASENLGLYVGRSTDDIVDAVTRLLEVMARPGDADLLGPLVIDEILIRLLRTAIGSRVAQIGYTKSGVQRMAEAAAWIRDTFRATRDGPRDGRVGPHERVVVSPALQGGDVDEPPAISEGAPAA